MSASRDTALVAAIFLGIFALAWWFIRHPWWPVFFLLFAFFLSAFSTGLATQNGIPILTDAVTSSGAI